MDKNLIAQCGMNCGICRAFLRPKNKCPGCRVDDADKPITRIGCKIKTCKVFRHTRAKYCFECDNFPCGNLVHLDTRYRTKYKMSMIENLDYIKRFGIRKFIRNETTRWACPRCHGTVCVHNKKCYTCNSISFVITLHRSLCEAEVSKRENASPSTALKERG